MLQLHTIEEIRAWAASKRPDEAVGHAGAINACPLATCHNALDMRDDWMFYGEGAKTADGQIALPDWMYRAVLEVDLLGENSPVTAIEFLAILERVEVTRMSKVTALAALLAHIRASNAQSKRQ